jgi:DGQHR domain-containing protein
MDPVSENLRFPALKGRQGDRDFYILLPSNGQLIEHFTPPVEEEDEQSQRAVIPKHVEEIKDYVLENPGDFVLGALTYAVDPVVSFEGVSQGSRVGELVLPAGTAVRSIDGQHRRLGLADAFEVSPELAQDGIAVVLYVEDDLGKRRQMFSDMNWTPRKVSASQNVAFDSRDPFSRAVRRLVGFHPLLTARVETQLARVPRGSAKLYTLGAIYDACKRVMLGPSGKVTKANAPSEDSIVDRSGRFFDVLTEARPELLKLTDAEHVEQFRKESILVSSTTMRVVAGAAFQCIERHRKEGLPFTLADLSQPLARIDFSPQAELWVSVGFVSPGKSTPNARAQEVLAATNLLAGELMGLRRG